MYICVYNHNMVTLYRLATMFVMLNICYIGLRAKVI